MGVLRHAIPRSGERWCDRSPKIAHASTAASREGERVAQQSRQRTADCTTRKLRQPFTANLRWHFTANLRWPFTAFASLRTKPPVSGPSSQQMHGRERGAEGGSEQGPHRLPRRRALDDETKSQRLRNVPHKEIRPWYSRRPNLPKEIFPDAARKSAFGLLVGRTVVWHARYARV